MTNPPFSELPRVLARLRELGNLRRDHAVPDADHALPPGPVPGHPGDRASAAHPVQGW